MTTPARAPALLVAAELSLTALTCAASFGLIRLFDDGSFLPRVLATAVLGHTLAAVCRRRGISPIVTAVIAAVGVVVVLPLLLLPHTTAVGIPTGETLRVARQQLHEAWLTFGHVKAPAPTLPGFVLAAAMGAWGLAFLSDTAAFRAGGLVESMVPASTLFLFGAALGASRHRVLCTALYVSAVLAFWLSARAHRQLSAPSWMTRDDARGTRAIVRTGAAIAAVGVLTTVVVGPHLPGADARAVIPWRAADRDTGSSRVTISPLVSIRTRLVDQANVEVFRVTSPSRSYWRLTALETFDGVIWSSNRRYRRADGRLGSSVSEADKPTHPVEQTFDVTGLDSIWLPAAFRPVSISGTSARYDAESGSLLTDAKSAIGQRYTVSSAVPALDAALLDAAPAVVPSNIAKTYLALPPAFPANVSELARRVVLGATTPYEEARKLQDFFRGGQFTYDLNVPGGHGDDALQRFLFQTRRGYCEQFAGAYAAMARAVGLPSRVGVGFTTGDLQPDGSYSVRGYHGHAWPEVYLAGFGWVAFEPTPGRGIPGGEGYTGVPEAQAAPGAPGTATTLAATTTTTPGAGGTSTVPKLDLGGAVQATGTKAAPSPWPHRLLVATGVLVAVPMLWAVLVWLAVRLRRWRRRRRAGTGGDRVIVAWDEVSETLARSGVAPRRDETPHEYAGRASLAAELDPDLLDGLAGMTTVTRYAPERESAFDDDVVLSAVAVAKQVERTVTRRLDRRTRVRNLVDPRPRR